VEDKLTGIVRSGEMYTVIENEKLADFLKEVVIDRKTFNYSKLRLD